MRHEIIKNVCYLHISKYIIIKTHDKTQMEYFIALEGI